ncbi:MAG: hypothetical protein PHD48_02150 [Alphaproteobacteria bacterium]|nr:hypothetical protein [Alphaproteobacteria bacterium]
MSNCIVSIAAYRTEAPLFSSASFCREQKPKKKFSFRVSPMILSRIYFPDQVFAIGFADLFPLVVRSHADAVYENTMRFLDVVCADEAFQ